MSHVLSPVTSFWRTLMMSCDITTPPLPLPLPQICSTRDVSCSYEGCQPGCSYAARVRVVGEEPVAYGRFTDPVQFSVPSVPAMEEDLALPKPAEPLQDHSTSSAVSTLQTLVPQRFLVPVLFLLLSVLVVLLAFAVGVFFQF